MAPRARPVFDWRNRRAWLSAARVYAPDILSPDLRSHLAAVRPHCWSDNFDWLPDHGMLLPAFAGRMADYYSAYKGFHGCRPDSLASYYAKGITGQAGDLIVARFREIYADIQADRLDRAIREFESRGNQERGKTWFLADDQSLLRTCGHYMIQGSEFLMALAANLGHGPGGEDLRMRLRASGVPTIIEVDLPSALVPPIDRLHVAKLVLSEWGQIVARRKLGGGDEPCYVIREPIPPECIHGHTHPRQIRDPHRWGTVYVNDRVRCDHCPPEMA